MGTETETLSPQAKITLLESQIKEKDEKLAHSQDQLLRTLAEMENVRNVAQNDVSNARKYGVQSFAKNILEVADTMGLALKSVEGEVAAGDNDSLKTFYEGVQMTEKIFLKSLESQGITKFECLGLKFDPNVHDGLFQFEDPKAEAGTVGQVMKDGYMLHERVLRPAQVGTIKASAPAPAEE